MITIATSKILAMRDNTLYSVHGHPLFLVKWERIEDDYYMIDDTLSQTATIEEAIEFCESLGDDVILFEPRSASTLSSAITKLNFGEDQKLWTNVRRSSTDHK